MPADVDVAADPLAMLSDQQLFDTQLSLALACGRSRSALRDKHKAKLCFLFQVLVVEANKRGKQSPRPPYSA